MYICLVGGLEHDFYAFPYIGNVIIPTDWYFSDGLKPPTRIYIYIYLCTYVCTYWAVGFGSWLMALLTSHLPNMVDGDIPLCCLWWLATKRMFATDQLTIIGNLESKNTIQWKIIRRFCQAKDAMVDPKVKGISTNYIAGIVATITSSNGVYSKWTSLFFEWFPPWNTILT